MIEFVSEEIRTVFHSLPVERQKEWQDMATRFLERGFVMRIYYIEEVFPGCLEASIRINKQFDSGTSLDTSQLDLPGID